MPYSAAISSQLTIRSGKLINIPLNLIVKGDLILLKPGQVVYLKCKSVNKNKVTNLNLIHFKIHNNETNNNNEKRILNMKSLKKAKFMSQTHS